MARSIALNVGVNTNPEWGGFRGPIFPDGSFEFIHIPWKEHYGIIEPPPRRYSGMPYSSYVPDRLKNKYVLISPDFDNCTYASTMDAPANKPILSLKPGDYLLFYATLRLMKNKKDKADWINPRWGAYIIGLFEISSIYKSIFQVLDDKSATEAFKEYDWFKIQLQDPYDWDTPWVKGTAEKSGLLKRAIPLSNPEDSQKWSDLACELFTTSRGRRLDVNKKAVFQTVLTCESECLDKLLAKCVLQKISR